MRLPHRARCPLCAKAFRRVPAPLPAEPFGRCDCGACLVGAADYLRAALAAGTYRLASQGLREELLAARPGTCPLCDCPLPPWSGRGRRRLYCGEPECRRLYWNLYGVDRRAAEVAA